MSILQIILYALVVIVALLLIGLVLVQPAKSGGMGATFGGIGESVFGGQATSQLTKMTVVMTALFFGLVLILATVIGWSDRDAALSREIDSALATPAPAMAVGEADPAMTSESPGEAAPAAAPAP